jgi:hypothetical protein
MDFSDLSLPQRVAAHELSVRALEDETRALRRLVTALIGVVTSQVGSAEYESGLSALLAERNRA